MPIYEFECTCCSSRFELKRSFDEDTPVSCPQCGGKTQRVFVPVPIIFKGTGFYCTDYKGNSSYLQHEAGTGDAKGGADKAKAGADKAKAGADKAKAGMDKAKTGMDKAKADSKEKGS